MDANQVVTAFLGTWAKLDPDEMTDYFGPDAIYQNGPMESVNGQAAIREVIAGYCKNMDDFKVIVHHQVSNGSIVMNERTDVFTTGGQTRELEIVGVFEVENGKIQRWREYFDAGSLTAQ